MTTLPNPIPWTFHGSLSMRDKHSLAYRVDGLPIQKEVHTPMRDSHVAGKPDVSYWIDGDPHEYRTEAEVREAWERQA